MYLTYKESMKKEDYLELRENLLRIREITYESTERGQFNWDMAENKLRDLLVDIMSKHSTN